MTGSQPQGPPATVTVIVDMANVVGARPDGWWRDRAGATTRLLTRLAGLVGRQLDDLEDAIVVGRVVAITEGAGRRAVDVPGVEVVRAAASGDDAVVAAAEASDPAVVIVVTADRGLLVRLPAGVRTAGPAWLLRHLDTEPGGRPPTRRR